MGAPIFPSPINPIGSTDTLPSLPYTTGAMLLGLALVCVAAVSWGTTGSVMSLLARDGAPSPLLVGWARMAGAAPCLVLAMATYQLCYFWAVPRTGVALTALLAICSAPIMITAGAALTLKERPERSTLVALLLSPALVMESNVAAQLAAGWPLLVYLGLVPTAAAYVIFGAGLRRVTV